MTLIQIISEKLKKSENSVEFMKALVKEGFKVNPLSRIQVELAFELKDRKITSEEIINVFEQPSSMNNHMLSSMFYVKILGKNIGQTKEYFQLLKKEK